MKLPVRSRLGRFYLLLALVAVTATAGIAYTAISARRAAERETFRADLSGIDQLSVISLGRSEAPVTIVEFLDYQCPGCRKVALEEMPRVKTQLIDTGLARLVLVDFPMPTHAHAALAAQAARCAAEQDDFWSYHDVLFRTAPEWSFEEDPTTTFVELASGEGMDASGFEDCLRSGRFAADVAANRAFGTTIGVRGTPAVFVNREFVPNATLEKLEERIRRLTASDS